MPPLRPLLPTIALLAAASTALAGAATGSWVAFPESRVRLVSAWAVAPPDADARLGLDYALAPGWHVYWKNPGDAGLPPRLVVPPASGLAGVRLRYPAPSRFDLPGDLVAIGYEGEPLYPVDARLGGEAAPARLTATLDYLVCAASCIPRTAELALDLPRGAATADPAVAGRLEAWRGRLPSPAGGPGAPRVTAGLAGAAPELTLELALRGAGLAATAPDLFFEPDERLEIGRPRAEASGDGVVFRVPVRPLDSSRPLPARLRFAWTATGLARDGAPAAFEGELELAPPAPRSLTPAALAVLAAVALVLLAVAGARRRRPVTVS